MPVGAVVHEAGGSNDESHKALNRKNKVCHSQSCLEVKAQQAENPQQLSDLCSPVWRWDVESCVSRNGAPGRFPPKMPILATHTIFNCELYETARESLIWKIVN